eukprot:Phypoly_transcript_18444.p1 GENE.Phypoly_transcript_18444~~Phypoly_transcript_18444.p1  ORF type:complete len:100 (-),score=3.28 Phypoly_transcript_18444:153-452(-)
MIKVLLDAPSASNRRYILIFKIITFILWYVILAGGVITVYVVNALGPIFFLMLVVLFEILGMSVAYLVLFFQPFKIKKHTPPQVTCILHAHFPPPFYDL